MYKAPSYEAERDVTTQDGQGSANRVRRVTPLGSQKVIDHLLSTRRRVARSVEPFQQEVETLSDRVRPPPCRDRPRRLAGGFTKSLAFRSRISE